MKTLQQHEKFEMLILNEMRRLKVLEQLIFGGGTMLRLCYELLRYSADLDFYLVKSPKNFSVWAHRLHEMFLAAGAVITDEQEKHYSYLWELKNRSYPRNLKIEIRKKSEETQKTQLAIAFSKYSPYQVRLRTLTLEQMWHNKIAALLGRHEIRDAYDLEFLTRRNAGDFNVLDPGVVKNILNRVQSFKLQDYKVTLGSVLDVQERQRVLSQKFDLLTAQLWACVNSREG